MGTELRKALSWKIDNFSKRSSLMYSNSFSSGGCKWRVRVYPKGHRVRDHLSLFLDVDHLWLRRGWKRRVIFRFVLLNNSGKELYRSPEQYSRRLFCAESSSWGFCKTLPLTKLEEKGFLEKNKLTVEVHMEVVEVVHRGKPTANDMCEYNGFHIMACQADTVAGIFEHQPDFAVDVVPTKNQEAYMSLLLGLVETLSKKKILSETELTNAQSELTELAEAGFRLDWLKSKLEEVSLQSEKALSHGLLVQQLEERVKNVELALSDLKVTSAQEILSFLLLKALKPEKSWKLIIKTNGESSRVKVVRQFLLKAENGYFLTGLLNWNRALFTDRISSIFLGHSEESVRQYQLSLTH